MTSNDTKNKIINVVYAFMIVLGIITANLLASVAIEIFVNGDIIHLCNNFTVAYSDDFLNCDLSRGLAPEQDSTYYMPMPGVKCPTCAERGIEQWVLPGKHCPRCSTAC